MATRPSNSMVTAPPPLSSDRPPILSRVHRMNTIQVGDRYGVTLPLPGVGLAEQRDLIAELADLGYTDLWSAEADGTDAFTPLVLASQWAPSMRLGTAIV